jgi:hypothetical protein
MTRRTQLRAVVMIAGAICGSVAGMATASTPTSAGNRRAAVRDAGRLLTLAVLPPGAVRVAREPAGDDQLLGGPSSRPTGQIVDRFRWWRVPASFDSVVGFLVAHPARGSTATGSGGLSGPGVPDNQTLSFSFAPIGAVVSMRTLAFDAVALKEGGTGIRVDAQETWIMERPISERVPAGVHEVDVTSAKPGMAPILSRSVTGPARVRRIISLIDRMPIVQPGAYGCPAFPAGQPVVRFDFRAGPDQPLLARASLTDYGFGSGPCNPVSFSIRGTPQKPLLGGSLLGQVQRLLGVRFR